MQSALNTRVMKVSLLIAATSVVCLAQFAPADSAQWAAKAISVTGQVSVMRDSQPWAISVGDSIAVRQLIVTGSDGHAVFQVSDGSTFEVFPNSNVVFRKNVPNWKDLIDLLVGRVRVHIEHLGNTPNPTRMLTPTAVISVRGTTFDVSVDDEDETTVVEVEEGIVEVQHALLPYGDPRSLTAGESIKVYKNEPIAQSSNKGVIAKQVLRMVIDAMTVATRPKISIGGGGTSTSHGGGDVGDTGKTPPPPPAPPPPPPPPPAL
jgi:hypothetical protein